MSGPLERLKSALDGRYIIERQIGHGGMATVHLAHDLRHKRAVAIKVLRPELALAIGGERFTREIEIAAGLTHPHILPLHDSGDADGVLYFVMPYVEGESLRQKMDREKQVAIDEAVGIVGEVADALAYAHRHGVIHRDIKPENILLQSNHVFVADFGIARVVSAVEPERLTNSGMSPGTPRYMSPEQASGESAIDARTDVYSLGCVLYELLAGEAPFTGPNARVVLAKKMYEPVPHVRVARDTVSGEIEAITRKALARSPSDRFASAREFADALGDAGAAERAGAGRHGPIFVGSDAGGRPPGERRPGTDASLAQLAAGIVLLLLVTTGVGFVTTLIHDVRMNIPEAATPSTFAFPVIGLRALIPLAASVFMIFVAYIIVRNVARLAGAAFGRVPAFGRVRAAVARRTTATWTGLRNTVRPGVAAEVHLVLSIVASLVVLGFFSDYLLSLRTPESDTLVCAERPTHRAFSWAMSLLILGVGLSWRGISHYTVKRGADTGSARLARLGGMAWLILLVIIATAPWRVVWNNERPRALVEGRRAYVLLENETGLVVFDAERRSTTLYPAGDSRIMRLPDSGYVFEGEAAFDGDEPGC